MAIVLSVTTKNAAIQFDAAVDIQCCSVRSLMSLTDLQTDDFVQLFSNASLMSETKY